MASRAETRQQYKSSVYKNLEKCIQLHISRNQNPDFKNHVRRVSQWQSDRIGRTYDDVMKIDRYELALHYFKDDMYGAKDYSRRDADVKKVYPIVERIMPNRLFKILTYIMELNALSMDLDERQTKKLIEMDAIEQITEAQYAEAYRNSASIEERTRQVDLVLKVGSELDSLMGKNYLGGFLKLSDKPAQALGMGDLHSFLARGYTAFMQMKGAKAFIKVIREREDAILERIFSGLPKPFDIAKKPITAY